MKINKSKTIAVLLSLSRHGGRCYNALAEVFAKQKLLLLLLAWTLITITSCGGAGAGGANAPEGTITLNFGDLSSSRNVRAVALPDSELQAKLSYTVKLQGPVTLTKGPTVPGESTISVSAPAGKYTLTVIAELDGSVYAEGSNNNVIIEAGKKTSVPIKMNVGGNVFVNIASFKAWFDKQPANTLATPYKVKLNISDLGGGTSTSGSLGFILRDGENTYKYVSLDLSGSSFTGVGYRAFATCKITEIILPNSVNNIDEEAFANCNDIKNITIPASVSVIGKKAFLSCLDLTSVTLGSGVKTIGESAFEDCNRIPSITIPASVTNIGDYAFYGCIDLISVTFVQGSVPVTVNIGDTAFPEGTSGSGSNALRIAYLSNRVDGVTGTYKRTDTAAYTSNWTKQQ
jgi:hypothetical protein